MTQNEPKVLTDAELAATISALESIQPGESISLGGPQCLEIALSLREARAEQEELRRINRDLVQGVVQMSEQNSRVISDNQYLRGERDRLQADVRKLCVQVNCGGVETEQVCSSTEEMGHRIFGPYTQLADGTFRCEFHHHKEIILAQMEQLRTLREENEELRGQLDAKRTAD